ncbi:hypothetical protein PINS_up006394 [Pythium insidiosum]|nr:hypothetical protein PINS_up006394 [Pythium insidiosum]
MLRRELLARDGLSAKFIYRVPADQREVQLAKQAINRGAFDPRAITDPHVFASLLKQWLRELPTPLLGNVKVLTVLPKAERGVLLWLVDHALEVVACSRSNAMTAHSLAVVLAPTLYRWAAATPEEAVATSHQVATLLRVLISWRKMERGVPVRGESMSPSTRWSTSEGYQL